MKSREKSTTLYCFSPPIMLATFFIEIILAVYTFVRYKLTPISRLAMAMLVGLAVFQLAEYNVCEGAWGVSSLEWARIGYVAISLLPPLGVHLATKLAGKQPGFLTAFAYGSGVAFGLFFLFIGPGMQSQICLGNYVIFSIAPAAKIPYVLYYYGWLFVAVIYSLSRAAKMANKRHAAALNWLAIGYLSFIIPTTTANIINPATLAGIPSIMCGFAVLLALILAFRTLPLSQPDKH